MMHDLVSILVDIVRHYGAFGVFFASIVEEVIAPIPSAIIVVSAGFALLGGEPFGWPLIGHAVFGVALPAAVGITIGCVIFYGIVAHVGKRIITRWGAYVGVSWHDMEKIKRVIEKGYRDDIVIFVCRSVPFLPSTAVNIFCGLIRYDIKKFIVITFFGAWIRASILTSIGWYAGEVYVRIIPYFDAIERGLLVTLGVLVIVLLAWHWRARAGVSVRTPDQTGEMHR